MRWPGAASTSWCSSAGSASRASPRTGRRGPCSSSAATSRPSSGSTEPGRAFAPGVHYVVGGNTKVYGASLPRFREAGLRRRRAPGGDVARLAVSLRGSRAPLRRGGTDVPRPRRPGRGPARHRGAAAPSRMPPSSTSRTSPTWPSACGPRASHPSPTRWRRSPTRRDLHPNGDVRRLPVRARRQERRRDLRDRPRPRDRQRPAGHGRARPAHRHRRDRPPGVPPARGRPRGAAGSHAAGSSCSPRAPSTPRPCCSRQRTRSTRAASPTAPIRSAATS